MERIILHSDLNNFYATVECKKDPKLFDIPMAVCGDQEKRHGIVLAKNERAKAYGVSTGEAIWEAKKKCPTLQIIAPHHEEYSAYSRAVREIYTRYTDRVEPFGSDECWLDVTGSMRMFGSGEEIADSIRECVKREVGLTVSVGVSFNKIFAKLASDLKKPDAVTVLTQENYKEKIWNLPASELLGVGRKTYVKLMSCGIYTIGQVARCPAELLRRMLGKCGNDLWVAANGLDVSEVSVVREEGPDKSCGHGTTMPVDLVTGEEVQRVILYLAQDVGHRLMLGKKRALGVSISVRDARLVTKQWQSRLALSTDSSTVLAREAYALFKANYLWQEPIRSVTVRAIDLISAEAEEQMSLFSETDSFLRTETLDRTVDTIRGRFGRSAICHASLL